MKSCSWVARLILFPCTFLLSIKLSGKQPGVLLSVSNIQQSASFIGPDINIFLVKGPDKDIMGPNKISWVSLSSCSGAQKVTRAIFVAKSFLKSPKWQQIARTYLIFRTGSSHDDSFLSGRFDQGVKLDRGQGTRHNHRLFVLKMGKKFHSITLFLWIWGQTVNK